MKTKLHFELSKILFLIVIIIVLSVDTKFCQPGFEQVWTKETSPLFSSIGAGGTWNSVPSGSFLQFGHGFKDGDNFNMYPGGYNGANSSIGLISSSIIESGWAFFNDNPILTADGGSDWEATDVGNAMVLKDGDTYMLWYTGYNSATFVSGIGLATSTDGINWTKNANNPILSGIPGTWEDEDVYAPYVIKEDGIFKMWYTGGKTELIYSIGYATSPDGITWTRFAENPVLERGKAGSWESYIIQCPIVLKENNKYLMWYMGGNAPVPGAGKIQTGFAISDDGIHWVKDTLNNPVLKCGSTGQNDSKVAGAVQVFNDGGVYKMLFGASNLSTFFGVKLAILQSSTGIDDQNQIPVDFQLLQNYPNPFNPSTTIEYHLSSESLTSLVIYDLLGREIKTLVNSIQSKGIHKLVWDGTDNFNNQISSGIYFYKLNSGEFSQTKKLLTIK